MPARGNRGWALVWIQYVLLERVHTQKPPPATFLGVHSVTNNSSSVLCFVLSSKWAHLFDRRANSHALANACARSHDPVSSKLQLSAAFHLTYSDSSAFLHLPLLHSQSLTLCLLPFNLTFPSITYPEAERQVDTETVTPPRPPPPFSVTSSSCHRRSQIDNTLQ